jgi:class 3 adenylate cyclase/pimeloyl-ACP methyl ester carboxylesterase
LISGGAHVAFQEFGEGPNEVMLIWGCPNHIESLWEWPSMATLLRGFGSMGRVAHYDQRGTGLSERVPIDRLPSLDERVTDALAVMDEVGMSRPVIIGESEGGAVAVRLAAERPDRIGSLVLLSPRLHNFLEPEVAAEAASVMEREWANPVLAAMLFPSLANDVRFHEWWSRQLRLSATPAAARALFEMTLGTDVRPDLARVQAPSLVVVRQDAAEFPIEDAEAIVTALPRGRLVTIPGSDFTFGGGLHDDLLLAAIAEFLSGSPALQEPDRAWAAVLFSDIVGSTERAVSEGDRNWRRLLDEHDMVVAREVRRQDGRVVKSTGDGSLALFAHPVAALRAAFAVREGVKRLGLDIRAGVHAGDIELRGNDIGGMTVHVAARVATLAGVGEVWTTAAVADRLGPPMVLLPRGRHVLKGVPGDVELASVSVGIEPGAV